MGELYSVYPVRRISPEGEHCFFGYYDLNAYDKEGRYHLCTRTKFIDRLPEKEDVLELGVIDMNDGKFHVFAKTTAWNFQQGALLQWHGEKDGVVFYNERQGDKYVTVEHDLHTGEKKYNPAVASITQDGKYGLVINFNRIYDFRPGYGYAGVKDEFYEENVPEKDGIRLVDLTNGSEKLFISYKEILQKSGIEGFEEAKYLINHITFSPSGNKFLFLLRNFPSIGKGWETTMMISDKSGNMSVVLKETFISHYYWRDDENIVVYCTIHGKAGLYVINIMTNDAQEIKSEYFMDARDDIHCIYSPDRRYIIGDCYPFKSEYRKIYLIDTITNCVREILRASTIFPAIDDIRCDLHVRWRPDGRAFSFDSTCTGMREIYEVDLSSLYK